MTQLQEEYKRAKRTVDEINEALSRNEVASCIALKYAKEHAQKALEKIMEADPKQVFVNEKKRTITVLFDNGEAETVTCAKEDDFNVETGIAMAIATYFSLGKPRFHNIMERLIKKAKVIKK